MILTGTAIDEELKHGEITISPFEASRLNPNSYNYRLGRTLKVFSHFDGTKSYFRDLQIPNEGYILEPHQTYLGHTLETIGSSKYAMSLIGRSSLGRLGLFLQLSANLGHTTSCHQWTLEMVATRPIKIYPEMIIGQVSFWTNQGDISEKEATYANYNLPQESLGAVSGERVSL